VGRKKLPRGLEEDMFEDGQTLSEPAMGPGEPPAQVMERIGKKEPAEPEPKAAEKPKAEPKKPAQPPQKRITSPHDIPVPVYEDDNPTRPKHVRLTMEEVLAFRDKLMAIDEADNVPLRDMINRVVTPMRGLSWAMQKHGVKEFKV
jgi:hypothetical protein